MACSLYNNNGYGCGGCIHFIKSTAITVTGGNVIITLPSETVRNCEKFCICLAQNIPEGATSDTPVFVEFTEITGTFSLINRCGNRVYGDQLRSRKVLHTIALTDTPLLRLIDNKGICCTDHAFPTLTPTTPAPAN